ncbi:sugar ABC transporter permease, partial [Rhizobium ruizarguesonis]
MTGSGSEILLPRRRRRRRSNWRGLVYIAPAMALVIVFFIMPV